MTSRPPVRTDTLSNIHEFKATVRKLSLETHDHRVFIRTERLKAWLIKEKNRIVNLLGFAYQKSSTPAWPIQPIEILRAPGALLVFSILLDIDLGSYIHQFCFSDIKDNKLPADESVLRKAFQKAVKAEGGADADIDKHTKRFYERQFSYCPAKFEFPHRREYSLQTILPILEKQKVSDKGATAKIWQISVPEDFVADELQELLKLSKYKRDDDIGCRYHLAVKTFSHDKKGFFGTEKDAFDALIHNSGMLRCFGHFEQPNQDGKLEYHLLLEYGQLDLEEYFFHNPRPLFPDQVADFWSRICEVVEAVAKLHEFPGPRSDITHTYYGWHADIKPDNILLVHGIFKLADPGFASFSRKREAEEKLQRREQKIRVRGGTTTYGAPECHMGRFPENGVSRSIDIWSLGCVLSLAATWVVLDKFGILEYTEYRRHALKRLAPKSASLGVGQMKDLEQGDWFHDGKQVLDAVKQWHTYLRLVPRSTDYVTSKILDLVDERMLCSEHNRVRANELAGKIKELVAHHQSMITTERHKTSDSVPEVVQTYIAEQQRKAYSGEFDNPATQPSTVGLLELDEENPRKTKKSVLFQRSSMLHHPSTALRSSIVSPSSSSPHEDDPSTQGSTVMQLEVPQLRASLSETRASPLTMKRTLTSGLGPDQHRVSTAELMERQKRTITIGGKISKIFNKSKNMDATLTHHFKDRDIHFLVDNGISMSAVWKKTTNLLKSLVILAQGQDPDGPDLTFASGSEHLTKCESVSKFERAMKKAAPDPKNPYKTDIRTSLQQIFDAYMKRFSTFGGNEPRKLVIIVLTDGLWEGMREPTDVCKTIVTFYRTMVAAVKVADNKQVGIEFIQFGNDEKARARLKYLDDELCAEEKIADMIDTEDCDGDVHKMMLGSFVEDYDDRDRVPEEQPLLNTSPPGLSPTQTRPTTAEIGDTTDSPLASPLSRKSMPR